MRCDRCHQEYDPKEARCPGCGAPNPSASGVFQTSSVLISSGGARKMYSSVDAVPPRWRARLEKSTSGANSATIVIADRRGRREIARALRNLPGAANSRLLRVIAGATSNPGSPQWLTPRLKVTMLAVVAALTAAVVVFTFLFHWQ